MAGVFRISEAASIGLQAVCLLGKTQQKFLTTVDIASTLQVSGTHLAKVLQKCSAARLLISVRGPNGGFKLARDMSKISVLDVFNAIGVFGTAGRSNKSAQSDGEPCLFTSLGEKVNAMVMEYLAGIKIDEITLKDGKFLLKPQKRH